MWHKSEIDIIWNLQTKRQGREKMVLCSIYINTLWCLKSDLVERAGYRGAAADLRVRGAGHVRLLPRLRSRQDAAGLQEGPALPPLRHAGHGRHPRHPRQAKCIKGIISRDG